MILNNLTIREKKIFKLTIIIIAFASILNFIIIPLKNNLDKLNSQIEAKKMVLDKYNDFINKAKENKLAIFEPKKYNSEVEALSEFFGLLDKLAGRSSLNLVSLRPVGKKRESQFVSYQLEIKTEGSFKNILKFIQSISKTNNNFLVEELVIDKSSQSGHLSARFLVSKLVLI